MSKTKNAPKAAPTAEEARQQLLGALSLCRKAGKLVMGFDAVVEAVMKGKTDYLLLASDISPKTADRIKMAVDGLAEVHPRPLAQTDLLAVSRKPVAIYAAADAGVARLCETKRKQCEDLDMKEEVSE